MAGIVLLTHALLIDGTGREPVEDATVVVEGHLIKEVITSSRVGPLAGSVRTLDLRGRTLMPGLIDAHVHVAAVEGNTAEQHRVHPPSLIVAKALRRIEECLAQGFTTVRDAGGADYGLREAVASGLYPGPRLLVSGRVLSQTGGHGDKRRPAEWTAPLDGPIGMLAVIADGADEVRRAVREQLRHHVDQIKVMASGGAMSPGDELDTTQYTVEELRAAVDEAKAVGKYVLAHAYSAASVRRALEAGVRSIEHGNLIDADAAKAIRDAGAFLVPTMATYEVIARDGARHGIGAHQLRKITQARERSVEGLTLAYRAGCKIGSGSDLLGPMAVHRSLELELKGQVMRPMDVLLSATRVNAELLQLDDQIGTIAPGKEADLIAVAGNPLDDLRLFQDPERLHLVMKAGHVYSHRL
jgi:imidazolonepropionase-like amidohydrolase